MSLTRTIVTPVVTYEQPIGLYIDGKWVKGVDGKTFETINPTNEKPIVAVHEAGPEGEFQAATHCQTTLTDNHSQMSISLSRRLEELLKVSGPKRPLPCEGKCYRSLPTFLRSTPKPSLLSRLWTMEKLSRRPRPAMFRWPRAV